MVLIDSLSLRHGENFRSQPCYLFTDLQCVRYMCANRQSFNKDTLMLTRPHLCFRHKIFENILIVFKINFFVQIKYVRQTFDQLMQSNEAKEMFSETVASDNNEAARWMSRQLYSDPENLNECFIIGRNINDFSVVALLENKKFVIPKNCEYYCADVREIDQTIPLKNEFDFILIDPPWWNKSIRRKKTKFKESR